MPRRLAALVLLLLTLPGAILAAQEGGARTHIVAGGESLYTLAEANGLPFGDVLAANTHLRNPNDLRLGTVVILPRGEVCDAAVPAALDALRADLEAQRDQVAEAPDLLIEDPRRAGRTAASYVASSVRTFSTIDFYIRRTQESLGQAGVLLARAETGLNSSLQIEIETAAIPAARAVSAIRAATQNALSATQSLRRVAVNTQRIAQVAQNANAINIETLVTNAENALAVADDWISQAQALRDEADAMVEAIAPVAARADYLLNRQATPEARAAAARETLAMARQALPLAERAVNLTAAARENGVYAGWVGATFEDQLSEQSADESFERLGNAQAALQQAEYSIVSSIEAHSAYLELCPQFR